MTALGLWGGSRKQTCLREFVAGTARRDVFVRSRYAAPFSRPSNDPVGSGGIGVAEDGGGVIPKTRDRKKCEEKQPVGNADKDRKRSERHVEL